MMSCFKLQAHCLMADDIMDGSSTRRGRICWYKMVRKQCHLNMCYIVENGSNVAVVSRHLFELDVTHLSTRLLERPTSNEYDNTFTRIYY